MTKKYIDYYGGRVKQNDSLIKSLSELEKYSPVIKAISYTFSNYFLK